MKFLQCFSQKLVLYIHRQIKSLPREQKAVFIQKGHTVYKHTFSDKPVLIKLSAQQVTSAANNCFVFN